MRLLSNLYIYIYIYILQKSCGTIVFNFILHIYQLKISFQYNVCKRLSFYIGVKMISMTL